jgi:hypothetical protein
MFATVAGGYGNSASGSSSMVAGGYQNSASGSYSMVAGGASNTASGTESTVAGGQGNIASGALSFAAGCYAHAVNAGSFVWAGSPDGSSCSWVPTSAAGQFIALAPGGFEFFPSTSQSSPVFSIAPTTGNVTVTGSVTAASFTGNGSGLTGVSVSTLAAGTYSNAVTFNNASNSFTGNGSGLTGVSASGLAAGTYSNAYTFSNAANLFNGRVVSSMAAGTAVAGFTSDGGGFGVSGTNTATTGSSSYGVYGSSASSTGIGVSGYNSATSGSAYGVYGSSASSTGIGVSGTGVTGVQGNSSSGTGYGVYGSNTASTGNAYGVYGTSASSLGIGVYGSGYDGVEGQAGGQSYATGVFAIQGSGTGSVAGYFQGNVDVSGTLSKTAGSFKIDHPLDPANKYLLHSFVESPDMKNVYDGVVLLDASGEAWIDLPEWFETLNSDFRYQLTAMGAPAPGLYIAEEISGNRFKIAGGKPGGKVSWQVTGIRQDAYAKAHRIQVEEEKPQTERGFYLHPELFGQPKEKGIEWAHHPELMRQLEGARNPSVDGPNPPSGGVR